jgi:hypothetical protein
MGVRGQPVKTANRHVATMEPERCRDGEWNMTVIASEAKQSRAASKDWIASSLRSSQ